MDIAARINNNGKLKAELTRQINLMEAKRGQIAAEIMRLDGETRVLTELQMEEAEKNKAKADKNGAKTDEKKKGSPQS